MVIDGLAGTERVLNFLGPVYNFIIASGDIFALLVAISIIIFLTRRLFFHIKRFEGIEMKRAPISMPILLLSLILLLMISLLTMNTGYVGYKTFQAEARFTVFILSADLLPGLIQGISAESFRIMYEDFLVDPYSADFYFCQYLPYSKHFHVFMSVPNVFLSRLEPLGKLTNMDSITREVKLMLNPDTAFAAAPADAPVERFGVKDVEDVTWKNYFDSLSCTQCGRCTSVCPANITGKKLSPTKNNDGSKGKDEGKGSADGQKRKGFQ